MKKNLLAFVAVIAVSFSTTAFAEGSGGATGVGIGTGIAGASAGASTGDSYALGGSVGAAECANALNILGIGGSMSDRGCELVKASISGFNAGLTTRAEARAIYFAGVKDMGVTLRPADEPLAMVAPKSKPANLDVAPALTPVRFTLDGKRYIIEDSTTIARYHDCQSISIAGRERPIVKAGCNS